MGNPGSVIPDADELHRRRDSIHSGLLHTSGSIFMLLPCPGAADLGQHGACQGPWRLHEDVHLDLPADLGVPLRSLVQQDPGWHEDRRRLLFLSGFKHLLHLGHLVLPYFPREYHDDKLHRRCHQRHLRAGAGLSANHHLQAESRAQFRKLPAVEHVWPQRAVRGLGSVDLKGSGSNEKQPIHRDSC